MFNFIFSSKCHFEIISWSWSRSQTSEPTKTDRLNNSNILSRESEPKTDGFRKPEARADQYRVTV